KNLDEQRPRLPRVRSPLDNLEVRFAIECETRTVEERLIGARPKCVPEGHEQVRGQHPRYTLAQQAQKHANDPNRGSCEQAFFVAELVREPPSRDLKCHERQVAQGEDRRNGRRGDVLLLYPPEQIQAVHESFEAGDSIRKVEGDVSTKRASTIGR